MKSISTCLQSMGLMGSGGASVFSQLATDELLKDAALFARSNKVKRLSLGEKYDVGDFILHDLEKTEVWNECWDLASVRKYREYIFILASIPNYTPLAIADMFNKKFSRSFSKESFDLLINAFWSVTGLSTLDIKNATDALASDTLKTGINKLLFGNATAAAKSVGVSLKLNYALILEEMLSDAYLKYQDAVSKNLDADTINKLAVAVIRVGDRIEKMNRKDTDVNTLHELLTELKLEVAKSSPKLSDFLKTNEVI